MSNPLGLIVMYHYVRPDASPIPAGIRPLLVSEFETQLDWLTSKYDIVPADRFNHSLSYVRRLWQAAMSTYIR